MVIPPFALRPVVGSGPFLFRPVRVERFDKPSVRLGEELDRIAQVFLSLAAELAGKSVQLLEMMAVVVDHIREQRDLFLFGQRPAVAAGFFAVAVAVTVTVAVFLAVVAMAVAVSLAAAALAVFMGTAVAVAARTVCVTSFAVAAFTVFVIQFLRVEHRSHLRLSDTVSIPRFAQKMQRIRPSPVAFFTKIAYNLSEWLFYPLKEP